MKLIKTLFASKKFLVSLAGALFVLASSLGLPVSEAMVYQVMAIIAAYVVGQGMADFGKEAEKERQK